MRRSIHVLLIFSFFILTCAEKEEKFVGEKGGSLTIGTTDLSTKISPLEPSIFSSNEVLNLLFLSLHRVDPKTGKMKPVLAESWEFSEDLKSITYYLRKNVHWADGNPLTAEDILYTYEKMKEPETDYPYFGSLRFLREVEVLNPHAIRFTFEKVYADILTDSDIMPVPKHVYEEKGTDFGIDPIGNGPYKIEEWVPGRGIILVVNEEYYGEPPPLDEISVIYYANRDEMISDFADGDLDLVLDITPNAAQRMEQNDNVSIYSQPGNTYLYLAWNLNHPFLQEKEVRKALNLAINKQRIMDDIYLGMGALSLGPLTPSSWGYNERIIPISYDVAQASRMLEEQGFTDYNRNGLIDKNKRDFTIRIITNLENPDRVAIMRYITEDLREIGVRVVNQTLLASDFIDAVLNEQFDGFIMGWNVGEKIDPAVFWSSEGRYNLIGYKNERVDSLIEFGVSMLNRKKAQEVWHEFQRVVYEDQPYAFLVVPNKMAATYKRVKGVEQEINLASVQAYWVPSAERRVSVAVSLPEIRAEEGRTATTSTMVRIDTADVVVEESPEVIAPEVILEAAARRDTATADTTIAIVTAAPPPPKPSVITRAEPVRRVEPEYPAAAREFGASGTIVVRVLVDGDGIVREAKIIQSFGNPACEQAALNAARQWEFNPATKDGIPFEQRVSIPFTFTP
jgi:peptide/nickel transport system substrate-binding protein